MPYEYLTKARLTRALRRLSELAEAEGIVLELALYGGAVFTLVYGSREATKDVDGVLRPAEAGARLSKIVAAEQELPDDWLNGDVSQFLSPHGQLRPFPTEEFSPGLQVTIPSAAYLLALKLRAARPPIGGYRGDEPDIKFLLQKIKPADVDAVDKIFVRFFPGDSPHDYAHAMVARLLSERPPEATEP